MELDLQKNSLRSFAKALLATLLVLMFSSFCGTLLLAIVALMISEPVA